MISVVIIVKNEEEMFEECLKSLSFATEIIVIDNSSTDSSIEIAKKYKCLVFKQDTNDFSKLRVFGKSKVTQKWILYVDADERVSKGLSKEILSVISSNTTFSAYKLKRQNYYLGNNKWPKIEEITRLFNKDKLLGWYGQIHESPKINGEIGILNNYLLHYTHRNLTQMVNKTIEWSKIEAQLRFDANHPKIVFWRLPRVMFTEFIKYYFGESGWKLGTVGLIESMYQSFSIFITYARLWELQQKINS